MRNNNINLFFQTLKAMESGTAPVVVARRRTIVNKQAKKTHNGIMRAPLPLPLDTKKALRVVERRISRIGFRPALKSIMRNRNLVTISKQELAIVYLAFWKNLSDPRIISVIYDKNVGLKTLPGKNRVLDDFLKVTSRSMHSKKATHQNAGQSNQALGQPAFVHQLPGQHE